MKIRIKNPGHYDHDPQYPFLALGNEGKVMGVWKHPWRDEVIYWVKLDGGDGKCYPFYKEEVETLRGIEF